MADFEQGISHFVWDMKYRYRKANKIIDQTIEDTWRRVADSAAMAESLAQRHSWKEKFYHLLEDFTFLPAGRILAGAGVDRNLTLFNCFVMKITRDSLAAIFDALKEGAITLQRGGGIGYDFSVIRPNGYKCKNTGSIASGPVSFMRVWDTMSATMLSLGARRGAMMANLRCDHPDIGQFITIKSNPKELRQFNLSVIVTDEFIQAVVEDQMWPLVFPSKNKAKKNKYILRRWSGNAKPIPCEIISQIRARELWNQILQAAYSYAEPGVIFEDTINNYNPLWYCEWISATNPCGEIPLPVYGACNLGSLNLTQFIDNPYTSSSRINWTKLENATELATRFLDNIIDISHYPLKKQHQASINTRRIGLGFSGLADVFIMLGIEYGSVASLKLTEEFSKKIAYITWEASSKLALEKGSFPLFNKKLYLEGNFVATFPPEIKAYINKYGMRNSHHNAIAPTGSISLLANNISGGIEPIYSPHYERKVRNLKSETLTFMVDDFAYAQWKKFNKTGLPPSWIDVKLLKPIDHLNIQAAVQPYIDNAISKTINLPIDFPFEELTDIYKVAHEIGLKGCTIFRPNEITGSILSDDIDPCCSLETCSK